MEFLLRSIEPEKEDAESMSEKKKEEKKEFSNKIGKWFRECKSEIKKVIWPDKKQVINKTLAVIFMVLISVFFISILDVSFSWPIKFLLEKL